MKFAAITGKLGGPANYQVSWRIIKLLRRPLAVAVGIT